MDLDTVIVNDITPLFDEDVDFRIWGESDFPQTQWMNGSLWMLRLGARPQVWTRFDPRTSPQEAKLAGARGSDQGWLSYVLGRGRDGPGAATTGCSRSASTSSRWGVCPTRRGSSAFTAASIRGPRARRLFRG